MNSKCVSSLLFNYQEASLSYEHLRRQVDETMGEKEQYIQSANDAAKVNIRCLIIS